jgi:signal peptidase II
MNKINKSKIILLMTQILLLGSLICLDQVTKYFAVMGLKNKEPFVILNDIFEFYYLENSGAAFGMLQNQKFFFIFIAILFSVMILFVLIKAPEKKKYKPLHFSLVVIMAGALGNMIDRIRYDYVIDFIYFKLINFPIFNLADIYVTCATVSLMILLLVVYKEDDLNFLSFKQKKYRELK